MGQVKVLQLQPGDLLDVSAYKIILVDAPVLNCLNEFGKPLWIWEVRGVSDRAVSPDNWKWFTISGEHGDVKYPVYRDGVRLE